MKIKILKPLIAAVAFIVLLSFWGCDDLGGITVPSGASNLTVSVKSDDNSSDGILVITSAKFYVTEVKFKTQSSGKYQLHQTGPVLLNLNLSGKIIEMGTQYIIRDNYSSVKFNIHKPSETETPSDPEFKEGPAENLRYSFIIKGTYNSKNFVYKSKKEASIELNFAEAELFNLKENNVTILFNKLKWFSNGSESIDPENIQNEAIIDQNIKISFTNAFKDDNKDGVPD